MSFRRGFSIRRWAPLFIYLFIFTSFLFLYFCLMFFCFVLYYCSMLFPDFTMVCILVCSIILFQHYICTNIICILVCGLYALSYALIMYHQIVAFCISIIYSLCISIHSILDGSVLFISATIPADCKTQFY